MKRFLLLLLLMSATISSNASPKVFSRQGSLWAKDADGTRLIVKGDRDKGIVCGEAVSRNEFGINNGIFVSPDSSKVAFYRKDESGVRLYPLYSIDGCSAKWIRYPMNGEKSEKVDVGIYDFADSSVTYLKVEALYDAAAGYDSEQYLCGISWDPSCTHIYLQAVPRSQKHSRMCRFNASDGSLDAVLFEDSDSCYCEPSDPVRFVKGKPNQFIYICRCRDRYTQMYLYDVSGKMLRRLGTCESDISYAGNDGKYVYYLSSQDFPLERQLYRARISDGKATRLTKEAGWHSFKIEEKDNSFTERFYCPGRTMRIYKGTITSKGLKYDGKCPSDSLADPLSLPREVKGEGFCVEMGSVRSSDGAYDNYYRLVKPADYDPQKKYPLVVYIYGGPHSQSVMASYMYAIRPLEKILARKGYFVYVQDCRGTSNRGLDYEQQAFKALGQVQMQDVVFGVKELLRERSFLDESRVGVHGWSFGGFMTISLMCAYPQMFKAGVAGGPVIDWKWYEVMYGERYMETQQTNPEGFKCTGLTDKASNLEGRLLIIQGMMDSTVVKQHSMSFVQSCIKAGKNVDYFPYPEEPHNVRLPDRGHLNDKIATYFFDFL